MKRVLLLLPAAGYRNDDFLAAAKKLGVQIIAAPWREDIALRVAYALEQMGAVEAPRPNL